MGIKGFNKANLKDRQLWESKAINFSEVKTRPCIFLSHQRADKPICREIASYLSNAEIDYYLDEEDSALQTAIQSGDPHKITESIKKGIRSSTHMLCVVSEKTYQSHWVPFEVGYGHAELIDRESLPATLIKLGILTLKDLDGKTVPDFMKVGYLVRGTKSLNKYIAELVGRDEGRMINERLVKSHSVQHPLDNYLAWKE
jgi:hypothetical protein